MMLNKIIFKKECTNKEHDPDVLMIQRKDCNIIFSITIAFIILIIFDHYLKVTNLLTKNLVFMRMVFFLNVRVVHFLSFKF